MPLYATVTIIFPEYAPADWSTEGITFPPKNTIVCGVASEPITKPFGILFGSTSGQPSPNADGSAFEVESTDKSELLKAMFIRSSPVAVEIY